MYCFYLFGNEIAFYCPKNFHPGWCLVGNNGRWFSDTDGQKLSRIMTRKWSWNSFLIVRNEQNQTQRVFRVGCGWGVTRWAANDPPGGAGIHRFFSHFPETFWCLAPPSARKGGQTIIRDKNSSFPRMEVKAGVDGFFIASGDPETGPPSPCRSFSAFSRRESFKNLNPFEWIPCLCGRSLERQNS